MSRNLGGYQAGPWSCRLEETTRLVDGVEERRADRIVLEHNGSFCQLYRHATELRDLAHAARTEPAALASRLTRGREGDRPQAADMPALADVAERAEHFLSARLPGRLVSEFEESRQQTLSDGRLTAHVFDAIDGRGWETWTSLRADGRTVAVLNERETLGVVWQAHHDPERVREELSCRLETPLSRDDVQALARLGAQAAGYMRAIRLGDPEPAPEPTRQR